MSDKPAAPALSLSNGPFEGTAAIIEAIMAEPMSDTRFDELVSGPLNHPLESFQAMRLIAALKAVVDAGGSQAAHALEAFARRCEDHDQGKPVTHTYRVLRLREDPR